MGARQIDRRLMTEVCLSPNAGTMTAMMMTVVLLRPLVPPAALSAVALPGECAVWLRTPGPGLDPASGGRVHLSAWQRVIWAYFTSGEVTGFP